MKTPSLLIAALGGTVLASAVLISLGNRPAGAAEPTSPSETSSPPKVVKTESEWKKILTPEQFRISRQAGTERPYGEAYEIFKKQGEGTYYCVGCKAELFTSKQKFDSACGWPSFYDPSKPHNVKEKVDLSGGMRRVEVLCKSCDGHLGHVFAGEGFDTPTDKRYCINAAALLFVPPGGEAPPKPETAEKTAESKE